jgi:hypothetical protein
MNKKIAFIWMVNTTERLVGINATLHFINQCKYKCKLDLWVAASTSEIEQQIRSIVQQSPYNDVNVQYVNVNDNTWYGYKKKLLSIISKYQYFIKCDDDLFFSNHVLDFFMENVSLLDDRENVWLFPTSSINSLTTDVFIEDFISDETVRQKIYDDFTSFNYLKYPINNGTDDLSELKRMFLNMGAWDPLLLREFMLQSHYFNGGEHPIRHSNPAITKLNGYIIGHIGKIFSPQNFSLVHFPGFYQAQFYMMRSSVWLYIQHLVYEKTIQRGLIDETEINWYIKYHNKKGILVKNAFVIHPALIGVDLQHYHHMIYQSVRHHIGV